MGWRASIAVYLCLFGMRAASAQGLPPVPVPPENPITESKRVLGKILFWDEQLSSDNTMACGTCHRPEFAGADPRVLVNPGLDTLSGTPDDINASPAMIRSDNLEDYTPDAIFGLNRQATSRLASPAVFAMYAPELFWDGRASTDFIDPQTGATSIAVGGALESQLVQPIISAVEMGHESRDWDQISAKLAGARPDSLATERPADVEAALEARPTYPDLFAAAFGDPAITAERIAFAIATYERTLLPDDAPWDRFVAGDGAALTPGQVQGMNALQATTCFVCHAPPLFTDNSFRNIGLRPVAEDTGRQGVTGLVADRGKFKVPTLRNVGLKRRFMHNGRLLSLAQVLDFYLGVNGQVQFPDNQDPLIPRIAIPPQARPAVIDFLANGLTDPRVAAETFPFDRPTLHSEGPPNPRTTGGAVAGSGGLTPTMIATSPPNLGNSDFKIGVGQGLGGASAYVAISSTPPSGGVLTPDTVEGPFVLAGSNPGEGYATLHWPIADDESLLGRTFFMQWLVEDPGAAGGFAQSSIARLRVFCTTCTCEGDVNGDGLVDVSDLGVVLNNFGSDTAATTEDGDLNGDGAVNLSDLGVLLERFGINCG